MSDDGNLDEHDATTCKTLRKHRVRHTFGGYEVRSGEARNGVGDQGSRWI